MPTPAMATLHHEKFMQRHPPRPQLHTQHSNSVPSTPYQQPRDIRFHSRSPSPHRGLGAQSPRSVASEAVGQGQNGTQRVPPQGPVVCKFEAGAEFRKRRIPYIDGGDQELGPPTKELKKSLGPEEESKLSGDMRELYGRLLPSEESDQRRATLIKKLERMMKDEWPEHNIEVAMFGSSGNLLSSDDSDVDICVTTSLKKLESMHSLAMLLHKNGMEKVVCRAVAKVPIVKCWDPVLSLACDINVNNPLALENTRMIRTYVQLDDRVRPLAKIIKYWTKRRLLNDAAFGGTISSYTWICMIISFLQRRNPPILPSLQKMPDGKRSTVNGKPSPFGDDVESIRGCGEDNKETLAELLFGFFLHYGYEFSFSTSVVSIREGRMMSRHEKGWDNYADNKEARCRLCVEEPFNTERNLGNSADDYAWNGIHREIRRAYELLADGCQLEKCCEQFEFPPDPEKTLFQRPPPKPKPTLTRSASQSGSRQNPEPPSSTRKKGGNRNQSAQRSGNRRASSGSAFNNQRGGYVQSPPVGGVNPVDYFAAKSNLHDHLFQQYQYLQAQQDALRSQLVAQQQSNQAQRAGDLAGVGSPHIRTQYANGALANPRFSSIDTGPQTAPLFPGYMLSYPPRFAPAALAQQNQRSREGTNTNPSSPSLVAAVPALRRQGQRASEPAPSSSSIRSQSQPGRSFPHPLLVHQLAQQGYDMQALGLGPNYQNMRSPQNFGHAHQGGMQMPFSGMSNMQHPNSDSAMPKEYVGYYVGQSPQLGPQHAAANQVQVPVMPLRDPPQRQRRVTPDLMPPTANGRHSSRSPSPLSHPRGSAVGDLGASRGQGTTYSSSSYDSSPAPEYVHAQAAGDGGPIIVNGSNPPPQPRQLNGFSKSPLAHASESMYSHPLPLRTTDLDNHDSESRAERRPSSPAISPTTCRNSNQRLPPTSNGHGSSQNETIVDGLPLTAAPLLSPVAELRTPSPSKHFDTFDSPQQAQINGIVKSAKIANAKQAQRDENDKPRFADTRNDRRATPAGLGIGNGSSSRQSAAKPSSTQTPQHSSGNSNSNGQRNDWQPAPGRKSHKKNKSSCGGQPRSPRAHGGGEPLPANENERKGG